MRILPALMFVLSGIDIAWAFAGHERLRTDRLLMAIVCALIGIGMAIVALNKVDP